MRVVADPILAEQLYRDARGDAPAWPTYGIAEACYLAWVVDGERVDSMLIVREDLAEDAARLREELGTSLQGLIDGLTADEMRRPTLLCRLLIFEGRHPRGFGSYGAPAERLRPLSQLIELATSDLVD